MSDFKYKIPEDKLPKHIYHEKLVRAIRSIPPSFDDDFRPTFVSDPSKFKRFLEGTVFDDINDYSISMFDTKEHLETYFLKLPPSFNKKFKGYAFGNSNDKLGITSLADKDGHIGYFVYDYCDNSILEDFDKYEERNSK